MSGAQEINILVRVDLQEALLRQGERELARYRVSTSGAGTGFEEGSGRTPKGLFRVARKIGAGAPWGAVFRGREWTGEVWSAARREDFTGQDLVLTRILWLEGLEDSNRNTLGRYIYFHGTNHEDLIGQPCSHGCVRMRNDDIMDLFNRVAEGVPVRIE